MNASDIVHLARRWIADDPDDETRAAIEHLIEAGDEAQLRELFEGRIGFGTAGLRATMGPGPRQMNRLVVRQTTAGLMDWLDSGATVVIGYDARHRSAVFARDVAHVVVALGGVAELIDRPLPTPVLANAVLVRNADAGVMITASHNPPDDNGYKLYLGDGIQLVSPADAEIAERIDEVAAGNLPGAGSTDAPLDTDHLDQAVVRLGPEIEQHHLDVAVAAVSSGARRVSTVYTAMHGVGGDHLMRAFEQAGFERPAVVPEQFAPDPDFPTVAFPNPEEEGAMDLVVTMATSIGADLVLANDPDADRLALAVPDRSGEGFVALSGDQIGVLLADHLLHKTSDNVRIVASSHVSSRLLSALAERHGAECITTLTGFKWVARPIVERPEAEYVLGYEEALGYCCGGAVRDKDGISAALVAAEMVAQLLSAGETVWDRLDALALDHGAHLTGPVSVRFDGAQGAERRKAVMREIVNEPPAELVGETLVSLEDMSLGGDLPPATGLVLHYDGGTRVIVRPSGTEPKLKAYIEVIEPSDGRPADELWRRAEQRLQIVQAELVERLQ